MTVELAVVPHEQQHLVVIGAAVRKKAAIVSAWLQGLAWQVCPRNVQRYYVFVDDGLEPDARALLDQFVQEHGGQVWDSPAKGQPDFRDDGWTHDWTQSAMDRVGALKDNIFRFAIQNRAEAVWMVDADLVCDPMTLTSIWSVPEPIVAACFWTRWFKNPPEGPPVHAGPQAWLGHPYQLHGMGLEEWEFRDQLMKRQLVEVAGTGACCLYRRSALMKGVSFARWPENNHPGIGQGEDRHLSMRANALHVKIVIDPWADVWHCYHTDDEALIPEMLARLCEPEPSTIDGVPIPRRPELGDLVSLELHAMEPVPTQHGFMHAPTQLIRGRLGQVGLHPELEEAILSMERGEVKIVPVHFADNYPFGPYRGQRRLIRCTLIDHKPNGFAPVIEDEILVNGAGSSIDTTTLSPEIIDQMREVHGV